MSHHTCLLFTYSELYSVSRDVYTRAIFRGKNELGHVITVFCSLSRRDQKGKNWRVVIVSCLVGVSSGDDRICCKTRWNSRQDTRGEFHQLKMLQFLFEGGVERSVSGVRWLEKICSIIGGARWFVLWVITWLLLRSHVIDVTRPVVSTRLPDKWLLT